MKTLYRVFAIAASLGVLAGCSTKLLDIPQQGVQSEAASYVSDSDCEAATAAVYSAWRHAWSGVGESVTYGGDSYYCNLFWFKNLLGDDVLSANHVNQVELGNLCLSNGNAWIGAIYEFLYNTIYLSNTVMDKFQPDSDTKRRCIAEAKFFRALCYYELTTLWGRVPKIEHVLSSENNYQCAPAEIDDLWAFVLQDLTDAIDSGYLPHKKNKDDKDMGHITQEAAYAVRGKVNLTIQKYSEARTDFDKVISSQLYGLIDNMGDLYHKEANGCKEYVFENIRHWDDSNLYKQDGWQGLEDNWLFGFGLIAADDAPYKFVNFQGWGAISPSKKIYDAFVAEEGATSPRRLASLVCDSDLPALKVSYNTNMEWTGNEGYFRFKWLMNMDDEWDQGWTGRLNNTPCMRYADVLLMMAEACVRDGVSGDTYYNEVRTRAGLPTKTGVTMADIKKERFLELCFEATRWQDLKRWDDAEGGNVLKTELGDKGVQIPKYIVKVTKEGDVITSVDKQVTYAANPNPAAGYQDEDKYLPYPLVEIQTNKLITSGNE